MQLTCENMKNLCCEYTRALCTLLNLALKDKFSQKWKSMKFCRPQNRSGASQQNTDATVSSTTEADGDEMRPWI